MAQQHSIHNIKLTGGMNRDAGIQLANSKNAYKLLNIKNQITDTGLLDSLVNEKGTEKVLNIIYGNGLTRKELMQDYDIIAVFKCTQQDSVIYLKSKNNIENKNNAIIKVHQDTEDSYIVLTTLALGDFGFGDYIDAVYCFENSELQKVYWVDGVNVLRYININKKENDSSYITDKFYLDSSPEIDYCHHIVVTKKFTQGIFTAGVIQYAFTYYIENGPETPIVDYTPLYYITNKSRGLKEDETVMCSFEVKIQNPDRRFDYIRVYSIQRTSLNATPIVRIVKDIKIHKDDD